MAANPLTIAQVKTFPVGSPVAMIQGVLSEVYERRENIGKMKSSVQSAMLQDASGDKIRLNIWNHKDYASRKGSAVTIIALVDKGKSSTRSIENNYHTPPTIELEVTKNSQILFSGDQNESPPPGNSDPEPEEQPGRGGSAPRSQPVQRSINGQNVGMCMKEAIGIMRDAGLTENLQFVESANFSREVWTIASDLIRISRRLEVGDLAKSVKERETPNTPPSTPPPAANPPPATQALQGGKPKPGPDGSAYDPSKVPEEDVPF